MGLIITLNECEELLPGITRHRPVATIPFGGRYRIIDFVLSSMVNSGIRNIGIITQHKHHSLFDHLRSGKEWDLDRKQDGLFIFPPDNVKYPDMYKGNLQYLYNNLNYLNRSRQKYVLLSGCGVICNIDYRQAFNYHQEMNADVTVLYKEVDLNNFDYQKCTIINSILNGRILDMEVNPVRPKSNKVSMDMYILEKELLIELIDACISRGYYDAIKDGLIKNISMLHVCGYHEKSYAAKINTLASYYRHSLELLKPEIWQKLFFKPGLIYTKIKDEPPAKYLNGCRVANSLVANGCIIGGNVENSVLFRGVRVHPGAQVKNSIIIQESIIEDGAVVENVITDKEVVISAGKQLIGDTTLPIYIGKNVVI